MTEKLTNTNVTSEAILAVGIVTCGRIDFLRKGLRSLVEQVAPPRNLQTIVVDNVGSAAVRDIVAEFASVLNVRYVYEPDRGASVARNRVIFETTAEYIAYLDDDAQATPHWTNRIARIVDAIRPIGLCGPVLPHFTVDPPSWCGANIWTFRAAEVAGPLPTHAYPVGPNMIFARQALLSLHGFDPYLGPRPGGFGFGEEPDLVRRCRQTYGADCVYYDPDIVVTHWVSPRRFGWWAHWGESVRLGRAVAACNARQRTCRQVLEIPVRLVLALVALGWVATIGLVLRTRHRWPDGRTYLFCRSGEVVERLAVAFFTARYWLCPPPLRPFSIPVSGDRR